MNQEIFDLEERVEFFKTNVLCIDEPKRFREKMKVQNFGEEINETTIKLNQTKLNEYKKRLKEKAWSIDVIENLRS